MTLLRSYRYYLLAFILMLAPSMAHGTTLGALPNSTQMEEFCQDSIGAMIDASLNYVDGTPLLQRAALTGDCTATAGSNALTIPNNTVTYAKMQDVSAASRLIGRGDSGAGDPQELTLGTGLAMTGTVISATGSYTDEAAQDAIGAMLLDTATIDLAYTDATPSLTATVIDGSITYAKMQDVSAASKLLGKGDSGSGDVEEITLGSGLTMTGTTLSASGTSYTDEQAQDAVGTILVDSLTIDFTYADATPSVTAIVIDDSITDGKLRNSGALSVIGRSANSTGDPADISCTASTPAVLRVSGTTLACNTIDATYISDFAEAAQDAIGAMIDTTLVYTDGTPLLTRAALTGDVTASAGSNATTIANDAVTNAKAANMATATFKGRTTAGSGDPEDLTVTQATALLDTVVADSGAGGVKGLAPATGAGDAAAGKFLKADATWAVPAATLSGGAANKVAYWTSASALSNDTDLHWDSTGNNLGIGTATFGTTLHNGIAMTHDGSNFPSTNITDTFQLYAKDQVAGSAAAHVKGEAGGITSIGDYAIVGNGGTLLSNGVAIGGLQLNGAGALLQLSNVASIAHGMTGAAVNTGTFLDVRPVVTIDGGAQIRGFTETNLGMVLSAAVTTDPVSTKSTTSDGAIRIEAGKKFISGVEAMAAGVNLVVITDDFAGGLGTRWIADNDGDTWQTGRLSSLGLDLRGATSGTLSFTPATTVTSHTLTWPAAQGAASTVLTNDGSGGLSWAASGGGGSGDITDVWACTTGNCNAITGAAGDSFDAGSADASSPTTRSTSLPGTCTEGQHHQDTDSGGSETYVCTAANTWVKLLASTDNIATATALAANGSNCSTGQAPLGVDAAGAVETCTDYMEEPSGNGIVVRSAANTAVNRTITGTTNKVTVTNGDGVSGNPTLTTGSLVVHTDQANTWSTGAQDMAAVTSFKVPSSAGAAPTADGLLAYDTTKDALIHTKDGVAVPTSGMLSVQVGGDTNNSSTGSAADFDHTLTYSIPAGMMNHAGRVLRVTQMWYFSTGSVSASLQYKLKFGSTTVFNNSAPSTAPASLTNRTFTIIYTIITGTTGASGTVYVGPQGSYHAASLSGIATNGIAQPVGTFDLTGAITLTHTSIWGAACTGTCSIQLMGATVEVLN